MSRLVVEMMKREWPQQWPNLLDELHTLSKHGPTQTELVLFVFMRIAEDVATLQVKKLYCFVHKDDWQLKNIKIQNLR